MKSFLFSAMAVSLFLLSTSLKAQYSLQTAKYSGISVYNANSTWPYDSLPPFSSVLPTGPYYGNMNVNQRPLWFYYPSCISVTSSRISYSIDYNGATFGLIHCSFAVWGPFDSITGITLSQLDSSKLLATFNEMTTSGGPGNFTPDLPHIDTGKVYIMVATEDDTTAENTVSIDMALDPAFPSIPNSLYTDSCKLCQGKATYFEEYKNICSLNVDTPGNYPHLIWNKSATDIGINGYYIMRKNVLGTFDTLTFISYNNSLSEYIDTTVNAAQQKRTYKVIAVDACNQESNDFNNYSHSTIYLQSYPGLNNEVNLTWDYSGAYFFYFAVTPVAYIWRSSNGNPPVLIDSVGFGNLPFIGYYTDVNAPAGPTIYSIEVRNPNACSAMKMPGGYNSMISNISGVMVTGINGTNELSSVNVRPNPITDNEISVDFGKTLRTNAELTLYSVEGKKIESMNVDKGVDHISWPLKQLSPGIYQLLVESNGSTRYFKVVSY